MRVLVFFCGNEVKSDAGGRERMTERERESREHELKNRYDVFESGMGRCERERDDK